MAKGGHALALFKSLFGASNDFWPSMERLHATSRWPTDYAKKQLLVRPMSKKIGYFSEFSMHCRSVCGLCWCSVMQRTRSCVSQHWFGDNLLGTDWVCGYSQLGYLVTWQILSVTRSVERWCDIAIFSDSDYWKHPKHGTSSRTFRNECRRALSFCDYLPKSVFLQPNRNARK